MRSSVKEVIGGSGFGIVDRAENMIGCHVTSS